MIRHRGWVEESADAVRRQFTKWVADRFTGSAEDPLWRHQKPKTNIKLQKTRTQLVLSPSFTVIHHRRPSQSFSPLSLPSSLLIRTSAGCISSILGGQGPTEAEQEWWGSQGRSWFPSARALPRHESSKVQSISSSSRGNSRVVPNARNSGLSVPPALDPLMSIRHEWDMNLVFHESVWLWFPKNATVPRSALVVY